MLYYLRRLGIAQLGSALEWGSRGRRFKSCYPDHIRKLKPVIICGLLAYLLNKLLTLLTCGRKYLSPCPAIQKLYTIIYKYPKTRYAYVPQNRCILSDDCGCKVYRHPLFPLLYLVV
jgi:hypothetical protein